MEEKKVEEKEEFDSVVRAVIDKFCQRARLGKLKYGTDLDGIYEESYEINNEPIPAELVEMFGIQEMFEDTEYELVENDDGFYEVKEIENAD